MKHLFLIILAATAWAQTPMTLTELGTLGGSSSIAYGLNGHGQVVGFSHTADGTFHAFLWDQGVMRDLGTLGGRNSVAMAINDFGDISGFSENRDGVTHAFLWRAGSLRDLDGDDASNSYGFGLSENGRIAGCRSLGPEGVRATVWNRSRPFELKLARSGESVAWSCVYAVNGAGQAAGQKTVEGRSLAFFWEPFSGTVDLGDVQVKAMNAAGHVVGAAGMHAFIWDKSQGLRDLGTLGGGYSVAMGVNSKDQVVGSAMTAEGFVHAFVWDASNGMVDIHPDGWAQSQAVAINSAGQVAGWGLDSTGQTRAFLLNL